jgi:hypothetical protein
MLRSGNGVAAEVEAAKNVEDTVVFGISTLKNGCGSLTVEAKEIKSLTIL